MKKQLLVKRILIAILGLLIIGIGIGLTLKADLGVDPASVMQTGLAKQLKISYGHANVLVSLAIIVSIFFIDRKYLNIATFLALFLIAYSADLAQYLLSTFSINHWFIQYLGLFLGITLVSLGVAIYSQVNLGAGAVDSVSMLMSHKTKIEYRWMRIGCDFGFLIIGILLQGSVGIGTLLIALLTGPLIQWFLPYTNLLKSDRGKI